MLQGFCRATPRGSQGTQGYALVTSLVFLVVLTLVAITAMQGSTVELKMGRNEALRAEAFEASDSPRQVVSRLVDVHTFARGWPESAGGSVPDSDFAYELPAGLTISDPDDSGGGDNWYDNNTEAAFDPQAIDVDASLDNVLELDGQEPYEVTTEFSVYKLRTGINPGSGAAMVAGYEGTGKAAAASGGSIYFYVGSTGTDASGEATSVTGADYRHIIRN